MYIVLKKSVYPLYSESNHKVTSENQTLMQYPWCQRESYSERKSHATVLNRWIDLMGRFS